MKSFSITLLLFYALLGVFELSAQTDKSKVTYQKAIKSAVSLYHQASKDQSGLHNGRKYNDYRYSFEENGHPFFMKEGPLHGSIIYDGLQYPNIDLFYDEVASVVVFQERSLSRKIQLFNSKVSRFTIEKNTFIYLEEESTSLPTGFYQVLYNGDVRVLKREVKTIFTDISSPHLGAKYFIRSKTFYFVQEGNKYHEAKNTKDVLKIYGNHKKEIQQFIKANNLSFKKNSRLQSVSSNPDFKDSRDEFLERVSTYNDELNN